MDAVWITGLGCISAAGENAPETFRGVMAGVRPQSLPDFFTLAPGEDPVCAVQDRWVASETRGENWRKGSSDDTYVLLRKATAETVASSGLKKQDLACVGVCIGSTAGCALHVLHDYGKIRGPVPAPGKREEITSFFRNSPAMSIAAEFGCGGPAVTVSNACTSGTDAIGLASRWIQQGLCPMALAGGADALSVVPYIGFNKLMVYSRMPCTPFDKGRAGLNLGEGAGVLLLEHPAHARKRGARPLAVVSGYSAASDAHHMTAPHPDGKGLKTAIAAALGQADLTPGDIAFVNAHGTATQENDRIESAVYSHLAPARKPFIWASKGSTGHCLAAAGGVEAVLSVEALKAGLVPASTGSADIEDQVAGLVTTQHIPVRTPHAMSVSLGFGGSNAVLILSLPSGPEGA